MPDHLTLPLLPLRDIVVFPLATVPLLVGRPKSLKACQEALGSGGRVLLVAQKVSSQENPAPHDLYAIGTIATLVQHLYLPEGKLKLLVRGEQRVRISCATDNPAFLTGVAYELDDAGENSPISDEPAAAVHFSLKDWALDNSPGSTNPSASHVAELQKLLEDNDLTHAERLSRASLIMRRDRDPA
jgi:ATP-dependent Lon protease